MLQRLIVGACLVLAAVVLAVILVALPVAVFAQAPAPAPAPAPFPWQQAVAMAINGVGVMAAVWLFNYLIPIVRESAPWVIPILAGGFGPAVAAVQGFLAGWLGLPVDLSPLLAVFSGGTAVAVHQVYSKANG